jgi:hypothetical protein
VVAIIARFVGTHDFREFVFETQRKTNAALPQIHQDFSTVVGLHWKLVNFWNMS